MMWITTKEDRDLLALAAKAAGLVISRWDSPDYYSDRDGDVAFCQIGRYMEEWNPLTDDGDALRLAVRLRITPHIDCNMTEAEAMTPKNGGFFSEAHFGCAYAATRRAIVRAAAEIGKALP